MQFWPITIQVVHGKIESVSVLIEKELGAVPSTAEIEVVDILVIHNIPKQRITFLKPK